MGIGNSALVVPEVHGHSGPIGGAIRRLYRILTHKYYVDEFYNWLIVHPLRVVSEKFLWRVVDAAPSTIRLVNGTGESTASVGDVLRRIQSGNIPSYAAWVLLGAVLWLLYFSLGARNSPAEGVKLFPLESRKRRTDRTIYVLVHCAYSHDRNLPAPSGRGGHCFPRARAEHRSSAGLRSLFPAHLPDHRLPLFAI
jgi:hypothetical protein